MQMCPSRRMAWKLLRRALPMTGSLGALVLATLHQAHAQAASQPAVPRSTVAAEHLSFRRVWPAQPIADFTITLDLDGSGRGTYVEGQAADGESKPSLPVRVGSITLSHLAPVVEMLHTTQECAVIHKNVADTGTKTLMLVAGGAERSCSYHWTDRKPVEEAEQAFLGIAETLRIGVQLAHMHRFDRLGLDGVMRSLQEEVDAGHAVGLESIAPILQSIAEDADVLERVRSRAQSLLDRSQMPAAEAAPTQ
jgi:hypothetical protein